MTVGQHSVTNNFVKVKRGNVEMLIEWPWKMDLSPRKGKQKVEEETPPKLLGSSWNEDSMICISMRESLEQHVLLPMHVENVVLSLKDDDPRMLTGKAEWLPAIRSRRKPLFYPKSKAIEKVHLHNRYTGTSALWCDGEFGHVLGKRSGTDGDFHQLRMIICQDSKVE
jgi:hypothetical protein